MKVLVACEFSGIVRDAFTKRGHDAWSCDLLPTEKPGNHIQDDVLKHLNDEWDLMIAHPPCTYLCNSGVRWLAKDQTRWDKMYSASDLFKKLLDSRIEKICVENPIMHRFAKEKIGRTYDQKIQPYQFGCPESKATCLWLKNLPPLKPTHRVLPVYQSTFFEPPGKNRGQNRSRTFQGIADAMAEQWG